MIISWEACSLVNSVVANLISFVLVKLFPGGVVAIVSRALTNWMSRMFVTVIPHP